MSDNIMILCAGCGKTLPSPDDVTKRNVLV